MGIFRRICLLLFSLAGLLSLAGLVTPWVGPWTQDARDLMGDHRYLYVLAALVCVTVLGLLIDLLRAIFVRNRKVVTVTKADGDAITITRDAIASQARHVIEAEGTFRARRVRVKAKKNVHVRVYCRVQPEQTVDVVEEGSALHDRIVQGLKTVCGDNIDRVSLEFTDAGEYTQAEDEDDFEAYVPRVSVSREATVTTAAEDETAPAASSSESEEPASTSEPAEDPSPDEPTNEADDSVDSFEITVPIHRTTSHEVADASELGEE